MNPTAFIGAGIEVAVRLLTSKPYKLTPEQLSELKAEVLDGRHIIWSGDPDNYKELPEKAKLSCRTIAVGWAYLQYFGTNTPEEVILAAEWNRLESSLCGAYSKFQSNKSIAGKQRINPLTNEILEIIRIKPKLNWKEVLRELEVRKGRGIT